MIRRYGNDALGEQLLRIIQAHLGIDGEDGAFDGGAFKNVISTENSVKIAGIGSYSWQIPSTLFQHVKNKCMFTSPS